MEDRETRWRTMINLLRGALSLPGVVILWTGMWTLMDQHLPGATGMWKEAILAVVGAWLMVWTRTLFSNAGMDYFDHEGSLAEMGSLLAQGRLEWKDKARFYFRSLVAITGSIMFWDGVYTLCNNHAWENTFRYNAVCAVLGGVALICVTTSEDNDRDDGYGMNGAPTLGVVRAALEGRHHSTEWETRSLTSRALLYAKALFCNVCAVVFWKGVEEMIEGCHDTPWNGLVFFLVGVGVLGGTKRLSVNSGLGNALEIPSPNRSVKHTFRTEAVFATSAPFWSGACGSSLRQADAGAWEGRAGIGCSDGSAGGGGCGRRGGCPGWVVTAAELTGVVFAWTGIEWYIWGSDYIEDTWFRDVAYMVVGLSALLATGTFFNLAGMISPMAVLKQVHQHNRHEETLPLLDSDEGLLPRTESPSTSSVDL